jgi:hypothetical protein
LRGRGQVTAEIACQRVSSPPTPDFYWGRAQSFSPPTTYHQSQNFIKKYFTNTSLPTQLATSHRFSPTPTERNGYFTFSNLQKTAQENLTRQIIFFCFLFFNKQETYFMKFLFFWNVKLV